MLSHISNYFCAFTAFILLPNMFFSDSYNPNAGFPTRVRVRVTQFTHTLYDGQSLSATLFSYPTQLIVFLTKVVLGIKLPLFLRFIFCNKKCTDCDINSCIHRDKMCLSLVLL